MYLRENYSFICTPERYLFFSSVPGLRGGSCGLFIHSRGGIFQNVLSSQIIAQVRFDPTAGIEGKSGNNTVTSR